MNLLLDTHLLLWSAFAVERIPQATVRRARLVRTRVVPWSVL